MSSNPERKGLSLPRFLSILLLLLCSFSAFANVETEAEVKTGVQPADTEVWLVTYGPGEIYWQRFGHNAIWIRDAQLGLDHVFNFGFFDFSQEKFFLRFLQGRMLYFSAAQPAREEFSAYINEDRSIRAQKLDLAPEQKLRLIETLLEEIRPENRDYLYDYYENNCSTRIRDAIDLALEGVLEAEFERVPASQTWRDHTRRLTAQDFWLYLGLEIGLGPPVDQPISLWDEMFVPAVLADSIVPLVLEDVMLYQSTLDPPASFPTAGWPRYLLISLGLVLFIFLTDRFALPGLARVLARVWLVMTGAVGLLLVFLWVGTDHFVAGRNFNLLVFNPLWIVVLFRKGPEKWALLTAGLFSVLAVAMVFLPPGQYMLDVLAAFLPLNLAAAAVISRCPIPPANQPGAPA
jgi:hypothetical protein